MQKHRESKSKADENTREKSKMCVQTGFSEEWQ